MKIPSILSLIFVSLFAGCVERICLNPFGGIPTSMLEKSAWEKSEWISCPSAPIADAKTIELERAADGTSWFGRSIPNHFFARFEKQPNGAQVHSAEIKRVTWMSTALGVYDLYVNGTRVGNDFLKPGFTHPQKTRRSFTYDVTDLVKRGVQEENVFLAEVSAGCWRDKITGYAGKKSAFRSVLEFELVDGSVHRIGTDAKTWKSCVGGPVTHAGIFDGEEYDARILMPTIGEMGPAERNDEFKGEILPTDGAEVSLRFDKMMHAEPFTLKKGETKIVDFGQNCAGVPFFYAKAKKGVKLTILPGEMLNDADKGERGCDGPKGSLYRQNLRMPDRGLRVYYTFGSDDFEFYNPRFTFFGYRYLSITATDEVDFRLLLSVPLSSITAEIETGFLETGDATLNKFISNVYWGQLSNYLSVPTDCPQRNERLGWCADTQVFVEAGAYNADTTKFFHKWMRDMRDSQDAEGGFPSVAPKAQYGNETFSVGWADAGVIVPCTIWKMFGDETILEENWDAMVRFVRKLDEKKYDFEDKLGYIYADWLSFETFETCGNRFGDWRTWRKNPDAMNYRRYLAAGYWLYDACLMTEMAQALGRKTDADFFRASADRARAYIRKTFVESDGLLLKPIRHLQTACVFALKLGLFEGEAAEKTKQILLKSIAEHDGCLQTGFLGTAWIMDALTEAGEIETAYSLLLNHKHPSWLYSVDQGATTVWERWNSYTKANGFGPVGMNSFNHYAYGCVLGWIYRNAAGIAADSAEPGFVNIIMSPKPDRRLGFVKASYRSRAGLITSEWHYEGDTWVWSFTIPAGATASVTLPGETTATIYAAGSHVKKVNLK